MLRVQRNGTYLLEKFVNSQVSNRSSFMYTLGLSQTGRGILLKANGPLSLGGRVAGLKDRPKPRSGLTVLLPYDTGLK